MHRSLLDKPYRKLIAYCWWGVLLLVGGPRLSGEGKIFINDGYCIMNDSLLRRTRLNNFIEVGLECYQPLAALQFTIAPIGEGIHLLPIFNVGWDDIIGEDWCYQAECTPDGGLKVVVLDTLLRGRKDFYHVPFCRIECQVDSSVEAGLYPVKITAVQACDTAGEIIPMAVENGQVTFSHQEALLLAPPDTCARRVGDYTWRLYESNLYPVGYIRFELRPPAPGFKLKQVSSSVLGLWEHRWSQDSTGLIKFKAWQTSPLISRPCISEYEIATIDLTFEVDTNLVPGSYQFEPVKSMVVIDCSDNFGLTTEVVLAPLVIVEGSGTHNEQVPQVLSWHVGPSFPNPFNSRTTICYTVPERGLVTITIYDLTGRRVQQLVKVIHAPGEYQCYWTGLDQAARPVASGIYLVRLQTRDHSYWHKLLLVK